MFVKAPRHKDKGKSRSLKKIVNTSFCVKVNVGYLFLYLQSRVSRYFLYAKSIRYKYHSWF